MAKRKPRTDPGAAWEAQRQARLDALAQYNAEQARGIVHTPEWDVRMAKLQAQFDADLAREVQSEAEAHAARRRKAINLY